MGCDIHFHVERRTDDGWVAVPVPDAYLDAQNEHLPHWHGLWREQMLGSLEWEIWRSYGLFDALSGVRCLNRGWHRIEGTYQEVYRCPPIDHPHALCAPWFPSTPVSAEVSSAFYDMVGDAHTPGHGTLRQLMDERIAHAGGAQWTILLSHMTPLAEGDLDSVRGVWWFDN